MDKHSISNCGGSSRHFELELRRVLVNIVNITNAFRKLLMHSDASIEFVS